MVDLDLVRRDVGGRVPVDLPALAGSPQRTTVAPADDSLDEPDETINLTLSSPSNATLGSPSSSTLTIQDNDVALPTVSISAPVVRRCARSSPAERP